MRETLKLMGRFEVFDDDHDEEEERELSDQ